MRKNTPAYRKWKKHQDEKRLRHRTKRKRRKKAERTSRINYERTVKASRAYDAKTKTIRFRAPAVFSIVENPVETVRFFNHILSAMKHKSSSVEELFIDIEEVTDLRTDALMYLLAIMNNHGAAYGNVSFSGNEPKDAEIKRKFKESGFYKYVNAKGNAKLVTGSDKIQIICGDRCDTNTARKISDFVCEKAGIPTRRCSFLYSTMIELMSNTHKHAYREKNVLMPIWYCFVEYSRQNTISFTFMDTGCGIPATVKKNFIEKCDLLGLKDENSYVISALEGEFRTATEQKHRGKGLPKIREYCTEKSILNLHIVSSRADVGVYSKGYNGRDLKEALQGTLYSWNIDLESLKGLKK